MRRPTIPLALRHADHGGLDAAARLVRAPREPGRADRPNHDPETFAGAAAFRTIVNADASARGRTC